MSRNIEINIKTQDESTQETQYEVLYPKNIAKNVLFNSDGSDNVTVYDKLSNITPNNSFELGDILLTSKINVDLDKWALCDGSNLLKSDYEDLYNLTKNKGFISTSDVTGVYLPSNITLITHINNYYIGKNSDNYDLYYISDNLEINDINNWENMNLIQYITDTYKTTTTESSSYLNINIFYKLNHYFFMFSTFNEDTEYYHAFCLDNSFSIKWGNKYGTSKYGYYLASVWEKDNNLEFSMWVGRSEGYVTRVHRLTLTDYSYTADFMASRYTSNDKYRISIIYQNGYYYRIAGDLKMIWYGINPTDINTGTANGWSDSIELQNNYNLRKTINNEIFGFEKIIIDSSSSYENLVLTKDITSLDSSPLSEFSNNYYIYCDYINNFISQSISSKNLCVCNFDLDLINLIKMNSLGQVVNIIINNNNNIYLGNNLEFFPGISLPSISSESKLYNYYIKVKN